MIEGTLIQVNNPSTVQYSMCSTVYAEQYCTAQYMQCRVYSTIQYICVAACGSLTGACVRASAILLHAVACSAFSNSAGISPLRGASFAYSELANGFPRLRMHRSSRNKAQDTVNSQERILQNFICTGQGRPCRCRWLAVQR